MDWKKIILNNVLLNFIFRILLLIFILNIISNFIVSGSKLLAENPSAMDFLAFYTGASLLAQNKGEDLYDLSVQVVSQQQLAPITSGKEIFLPYFNPPFVALIFLPFSKLSLIDAYSVSVAINVLILIVICLIALSTLSKMKWYQKGAIILGIITFIPIRTSLLLGQLTLLISLIFLLAWMMLRQGKEFLGGLLLSLVWIKPHFMVLTLLGLIVQRRLRVILGVSFGTLFLFVLSLLIVGSNGMSDYFSLLSLASEYSQGYGIDIKAQHSLQTALMILFGAESPSQVRVFWVIGTIIIFFLLFLASRKSVKLNSDHFSLQWASLILAILIASPHTHFHDLTLLLIVAILLIHVSFSKRTHYTSLLIIGHLIILFGFILDVRTHMYFRPLWILINVSYMLFLLGVLARKLNRLNNAHGTAGDEAISPRR